MPPVPAMGTGRLRSVLAEEPLDRFGRRGAGSGRFGTEPVNLGVAFVGHDELATLVEEGDALLDQPDHGPETERLRGEVVNQGVLLADDGLASGAEGALEFAERSLGGSIVGPELRFGVQGPVLRLVFVVGKLSAGL